MPSLRGATPFPILKASPLATTPPINEQFLREVDDELRRDQALTLWQRYGRMAVIGVVVALAALGGYLFWQSQRAQAAGVEGEKLTQALDKLGQDKADGVKPDLDALTKSDSSGMRAAAKLTLAAMALQKEDAKGAAAQYGAIAADTSLAKPYRDLALVRQTAAEFDTMKPADVVTRLRPLAVPGNPWFGSAGEMAGIAYMKMNQPRMAANLFAAMAKDKQVPESISSRVGQLAQILESEMAAAAAGATANATAAVATGKDKK
jgi:hypothetical protein